MGRAELRGCILWGGILEEGRACYMFLYATQSPFQACFLALRCKPPTLPCLHGHSPDELVSMWDKWHEHGFEVAPQGLVTEQVVD